MLVARCSPRSEARVGKCSCLKESFKPLFFGKVWGEGENTHHVQELAPHILEQKEKTGGRGFFKGEEEEEVG